MIETAPTTRTSWLVSLVLFAATVVAAWVEKWQGRDVVWAFWISSFVISECLCFLLIIAVMRGARRLSGFVETFNLIGLPLLIAFLHWTYGQFASAFVPMAEQFSGKEFIGNFYNLSFFTAFLGYGAVAYWPMIASTALNSFASLRAAYLGNDVEALSFIRPRLITLHLLGFVLFGLIAFGANDFKFVVGVLAFFFVPWDRVLPSRFRSRRFRYQAEPAHVIKDAAEFQRLAHGLMTAHSRSSNLTPPQRVSNRRIFVAMFVFLLAVLAFAFGRGLDLLNKALYWRFLPGLPIIILLHVWFLKPPGKFRRQFLGDYIGLTVIGALVGASLLSFGPVMLNCWGDRTLPAITKVEVGAMGLRRADKGRGLIQVTHPFEKDATLEITCNRRDQKTSNHILSK